jgi:Tfp pilus assembly protein PilF
MDFFKRVCPDKELFQPFQEGLKFWHAAAIIFLAVFAVYLNALNNGTVNFDDLATSKQGANVSTACFAGLKARFDYAPLQTSRDFLSSRPLRDLSLCADRMAFGNDVWGTHFSNVFYHFMAACCAFLAASTIFGAGSWAALAAALVFAVHPLQTESVAYLGGRRDVLFGGLYLLGFWLAVSAAKKRSPALAAAFLGAWALSAVSKETAVTLPAVLLLYFWLFRDKDRQAALPPPLLKRAALLLFGVAAAYSCAVLASQFALVSALHTPDVYYGGSALAQYLTIPLLLAKAVLKALLPLPLNGDYSYLVIPPVTGLSDIRFWASLAFLCSLPAVIFKLRRSFPELAFGLAFYLVAYLPMVPLFPAVHNTEVFAEHWLYLPLFGFGVLAAALVRRLSTPGDRLLVLVPLLAVYGIISAARNRDWKDAMTFWTRTVATAPSCARANNELALEYFAASRNSEAETFFKRALAIKPDAHIMRINYAALMQREGRYAEAEQELKSCFLLPGAAPYIPALDYALAGLYLKTGRMAEAEKTIKKDFRWRSNILVPQFLDMLAWIKTQKGDVREEQRLLARSLEIAPDYFPAAYSLAQLHYDGGDYPGAARLLEKVVSADPGNARAISLAAACAAASGDQRAAYARIGLALHLAPSDVQVLTAASMIYRRQAKFGAARPYALRAVKAAPADAGAQLEAAIVTRETGNLVLAEKYFTGSLKSNGGSPDAHLFYADLLWSTGRFTAAYGHVHAALQLAPGYPAAVNALRIMDEDMAAMRRGR